MASRIINGDSIEVLKTMQDESIDCVITSPPYYGLRDYGIDGQIGLEDTPEKYVQRMVEVFREVRRVLKSEGTVWLNVGDSYAAQRGGTHQPAETLAGGKGGYTEDGDIVNRGRAAGYNPTRNAKAIGLKHKDLIGIPWMLAFALRADGWYLRQDIIWHKPNPMPESVKDRCTKSHEYIFLLTKSPKYYFDSEAIKEPAISQKGSANKKRKPRPTSDILHKGNQSGNVPYGKSELKNKRDVWIINTKPFKGAHFATFPEALVLPCLLAGCPEGGVAMDPFAGAATVGVVCKKHKRNFVGIELNPEYAAMGEERIAHTPEPDSYQQMSLEVTV